VFVLAHAAPGGDGRTRETALPTIGDALVLAADGAVIAIGVGTYDEQVVLDRGLTLWGACVAGTRLTSSFADPEAPALEADGAGGDARNLSIVSSYGIGALASGALRLTDVLVTDAGSFGIGSLGPLDLERVVVRGTHASSTTSGLGVFIATGGSLTAHQVAVERSQGGGISARGASIDLSDVVVHGTLANPMRDDGGEGLHVEDTTGTLRNVVLSANHAFGAFVYGTGRIEATDLVVTATHVADTVGDQGDGLVVDHGGTFVGTRIVLELNHASGAWAAEGATLTLTDFVIRDTDFVSDGRGGFGVLSDGSAITLTRGVLDASSHVGLFVIGGSVMATDLAVRATRSERDGPMAAGISATDGAHVTLLRARIESSAFMGLGAQYGASVSARDLTVSGVVPGACATTTCTMFSGAFGLVSANGGTISATQFAVDDAGLCGVLLGADDPVFGISALDLAHGRVAHVSIGACVQAAGFDPERLHTDVAYVDVSVPLQATTYGLPPPIVPPTAPP
jgi:hypothetical protein